MTVYNFTAIYKGFVGRSTVGDTWAQKISGAGDDAGSMGATDFHFFWAVADNKWLRNYRTVALFNTTTLPSQQIVSATLKFNTNSKWDNLVATPSLYVVAAPTANNTFLVAADYQVLGSVSFAAVKVWADIPAAGELILILNAAGIASINAGGYSKFGLKWSYDILAVTPPWIDNKDTGFGYLQSGDWVLTITTTTIAVTTNPATNITANSAQLNGTLTEDGTDTPVQCSFEYGLTSAYGSTTTPATVTEGSSFSAVVSGLSRGTTYHFRAKAVGTSGATVYGADRTFTTKSRLGDIHIDQLIYQHCERMVR